MKLSTYQTPKKTKKSHGMTNIFGKNDENSCICRKGKLNKTPRLYAIILSHRNINNHRFVSANTLLFFINRLLESRFQYELEWFELKLC